VTAEQAEQTETIESVVRRVLDTVSTSFPATILSVPNEGLVNVQPNVKFKTSETGEAIEPRPINNVVLMYGDRTEQTIQRPPKEGLVGSKVLVLACEHSLTEWRSSGGKSIYPKENRAFNLNDAVAILGFYPETLKWPNPQKPLTWEFLIKEGFKIAIGTKNADFVGLTYQILFDMAAGVDPDTGVFLNIATITPNLVKLLTIVNPVI
jgi:hypothetical protein